MERMDTVSLEAIAMLHQTASCLQLVAVEASRCWREEAWHSWLLSINDSYIYIYIHIQYMNR